MALEHSQAKKSKKTRKVISLGKQKEASKATAAGYDTDELIFALDIGTRTVVGIVGVPEDDKFKVLSAEVLEHKNRAMLDGQIHDIRQVSEVTKEIKERLEKNIGMPLSRVAIAAAGRVLKTCQVRTEREIDSGSEIDQELVSSIEIEGIQKAQMMLDSEAVQEEKTQFYCVGYSVINYYLNSFTISSLIGHKGKKIGVDILATFLPHIVVDSLYTVMNRIGLEVVSLTLEPIAAINVTIPKDLRLLNLALVDIGAGTSDIALTKDGSVVAYAMAPVAGDEITEKIAQNYLVDFNTGERIKIALSGNKDSIVFSNILGNKHNVPATEVMNVIRPSVELLAATISQKILEYNNKAPNAVFLIGGGSQIPGLTEILATQLGLPKDRVVVRGRDIIQNIRYSGKKLSGPEAITPFGIAITAQMQRGQDFLSVMLNGKKIRLFNSKKLTIADALILIGFNPDQLIGRSGKSLVFELNGTKKTIRGGHGKPAEIYVNESPANLETILKPGDNIKVIPAENGENAQVRISDFVPAKKGGEITFNGAKFQIGTKVYINGDTAAYDSIVNDGDIIYMNDISTIEDLFRVSEIDGDDILIQVNGNEVDNGYVLENGDKVQYGKRSESVANNSLLSQSGKTSTEVHNDNTVPGENVQKELKADPMPPNSIVVAVNGEDICLKGGKQQYIFVDVFNYINFDLTKPQGNIVLRLNGSQASFTDVIKPGDKIDIFWQK